MQPCVSRPGSQMRRVITHYSDGGGSQRWMTESDEEPNDAKQADWELEEIVSREYEYPDEEDTKTQDGG